MWVQFWDMHSGGSCKESPYDKIYIEADNEEQAKIIFYNRFGHSPDRISCTCCGSDYSISEHESLAQLTGYHRNCRTLSIPKDPKTGRYMNQLPEIKFHYYLEDGECPPSGFKIEGRAGFSSQIYQTLEQYMQNENVLIIKSKDIKPEEKIGDVPEQGYIWV